MKRCYNFGPDQAASLDAMALELGETKTRILTAGLRLLRIGMREAKRGNSIGIVANGKVVTELSGVWDEAKGATA